MMDELLPLIGFTLVSSLWLTTGGELPLLWTGLLSHLIAYELGTQAGRASRDRDHRHGVPE